MNTENIEGLKAMVETAKAQSQESDKALALRAIAW